MNLDGQLDFVDLTTLARVRAIIPQSITDTSADTAISTAITDISARIGRYLGFHLLDATRTDEVYELRKHAKVLRLDAKAISALTSIKESSRIPDGDDWSTVGAMGTSTYVVNKAGGWIRFLTSRPNDPGYLAISYTAGFGTNAAAVIADFPELASACEIQVKYFMERLSSIGGDIQTGDGGGTNFNNAYGLHREVIAILGLHKRGTL